MNIPQLVTVPSSSIWTGSRGTVAIRANSGFTWCVAEIDKLKAQQRSATMTAGYGPEHNATAVGPNSDGAKIPIHLIH